MPDPQQKLVKVGDDVIAFPYVMPDDTISSIIREHKSHTHTSSPKFTATGLALSQGKANASPTKRGTIEVTDPNGHKHYFLDERSAAAFRKAAGIQ